MPTTFPTSLDVFPNPSSATTLNETGLEHHLQHANANDAIEALQTKVGITGSTDVNSLTKKVADLQLVGMVLETPTGLINSINMVYTLSGTPKGDVIVINNGIVQAKEYYGVSGTTLTFIAAPTTGALLQVFYLK